MNLWLYLHFPSLQLDTLFAEKDHSPICIIEQHKVVQANQAALEAGIQLGTGLASAASLCSELQVAAYEPNLSSNVCLKWLNGCTSIPQISRRFRIRVYCSRSRVCSPYTETLRATGR